LKNSIHATPSRKELSFDHSVYTPSLFISLAFEPKVTPKHEIAERLKWALHKAEAELVGQYPRTVVMPAILRLKNIFQNLDYTTLRKSVSVFLSPFLEKVYYLNIPVNEKVTVNEPFSFRNLVLNKKEEKNYLLLVIDDEAARIYHGDHFKLKLFLFHSVKQISTERKQDHRSFSVPAYSKTVEKTLLAIDQGLGLLQKSLALPVIVMAGEETLQSFKAVSKNTANILHYIDAGFESASYRQIQQALEPAMEDWQDIKLSHLLNQLETELVEGKLSVGIADVWKAAKERKTKMLVVEKEYAYPAYTAEDQKMIYSDIIPMNYSHLATDAVEETIEFVLAGGGDVVFVEPGTLKDYLHIALF
jgi:hypothetical protein